MLNRTVLIVLPFAIGVALSPVSASVWQDWSWVQWSPTVGGNGHWYAVSDEPVVWADAWGLTQGASFHMLTVGSAAEEAWFRSNIYSGEAYMGFTDSDAYGASEGQWRWVTGEPVTYVNWAGGQPDNDGNQDFGNLSWFGRLGWDDAHPGNALPSLFESEVDPRAAVPEPCSWVLLTCSVMAGIAARRRRRR